MSTTVEDFLADVKQEMEGEIHLLRTSLTPENEEEHAVKIALAQHRYAKLLCSIGMHKEALPYLQSAWETAKRAIPLRNQENLSETMEVYGLACYHVGVDFVILLDYLALSADCERVFEVLNNSRFAEGPHLGDYAFFLHRRKRDFDRAEK